MDSANTCALDSPVEKRKIICHSVGRARYQNRFRAASQLVTNVSYSDSDKPTRNGMFQRFLSKRTKLISWVVQWFAPGLLCLSTLWGLDLSVVKSWALESQNSFGPGLTCWIYISSHRNSVSFFFLALVSQNLRFLLLSQRLRVCLAARMSVYCHFKVVLPC